MIKGSGEQNRCRFCDGRGYFQLLLGGTETCMKCGGAGFGTTPPKRKPCIDRVYIHLT
jgi:hypothetical protein